MNLKRGFRAARVALIFTLLTLLSGLPATQAAPGAPARSGQWYYKIGGAESISSAANANVSNSTISASIDLRRMYSCGKFDPLAGIRNQISNLGDKAKNVVAGLAATATAAIASLPQLILQRANPGLYDLYQNAVLEAEAVVSLANKSCEQFEGEIAKGKNPYEDWVRNAKGYAWKIKMGAGGASSAGDVVEAKKEVDDKGGKDGVPWVGGARAGGTGQADIRVIGDTVLAGYNIELNRGVTDRSAASAGNPAGLAKMWPAPDDAIGFANYVLGDVVLHVDETTGRKSTPGHGLLPQIEKDKVTFVDAIRKVVTGSDDAKPDTLAKSSPAGTLLTREVVDAIRHLGTPQEQEVAIQKLGEEAAIQTNLERALMLRRLILTGRMEPQIYASPAGTDLDLAISTLNHDIDNILYEARVRKEIFAATSAILLDLQGSHTDAGDAGAPARTRDSKPITDGAAR